MSPTNEGSRVEPLKSADGREIPAIDGAAETAAFRAVTQDYKPGDAIPANDLPRYLAGQLGVRSILILTRQQDGKIGMMVHGNETHQGWDELLCTGIHLNLSQHDVSVAHGAAGPEMQRVFRQLVAMQYGITAEDLAAEEPRKAEG